MSLSLGESEAVARFWKGAEPAVRVRGEESAVWVALCMVASIAPIPGVWVKPGWPGEVALAPPSEVCGVAAPVCAAVCGPDAPRPGTVGAGAASVGAEAGVGVYVALVAPVGASATSVVDAGVGVEVVACEATGPAEGAAAGDT